MSKSIDSKVVSSIFCQPWAILPESLEQIISIAGRETSDLAAALQIRNERGAPALQEVGGKVAVIPIFGPIIPRADWFSNISGATSLTRLTAMLDEALADPKIASVLLNIDSPGGQVTGVHEFACRVKDAARVKPIRAHVTGLCASAAYWIASAANRITADVTAKVGSIGVVYAWTDDSVAKERQGLKDFVVVSAQSPDKYLDPKSKAGRNDLQRLADGLAEIFIQDVAENRNTEAKTVMEDFGRGKVMLAASAVKVGMIDAVDVMDAVVGRMSEHYIEEQGMKKLFNAGAKARSQGKAKGKAKGEDEDRDQKPADDEEEEEEAATTSDEDEDEEEREDKASDAEDEEEKDDEDKENASGKSAGKSKASLELKEFKATYPDLYKAAFNAGVFKERARIRSIYELGVGAHGDLKLRAMFNQPMTAAQLSLAVLKAEGSVRNAMADDMRSDAGDVFANVDMVSPGTSGTAAAEEQSIVNIMAGLAPQHG